MKRVIARIVGTAALLAAAFSLGVSSVAFRGVNNVSTFISAVKQVPIRLQLAFTTLHSAGAQDDDFTPYQAYADVLATLRDNYYGQDIDSTAMTYSGIRGMMGALHDRYTRFMDPKQFADTTQDNEGSFVGIGAMLGTNKSQQVYVIKVLRNGPALKYHVMAGDIILKVDNTPTLKLTDTDVVKLIHGQPRTTVTLTLLRKGVSSPVVVTIPRETVQQEVVQYDMLDPQRKIGYISLVQFNEESDVQMAKALHDLKGQGARGLVLDLRNNPGGLVDIALRIASRFIPQGPVMWMKDQTGPMQPLDTDPSIHQSRLPLVVLVNGDSASAAEILSGAIKDTGSGVLVGEKTFGKGVVQTYFPLHDGSAVAITTQHYYTASKHDINHKGIMPNIQVIYTPDNERKLVAFLRDNPAATYDLQDDAQLDRAVSVVESKIRVANARQPLPSTRD